MQKNIVQKIILNLIKVCILGVLFLPIYMHSVFYFPFIVPRNIAFRILVEIALGLYLVLLMIDSEYKPKLNKLTLSVIIFFTITLIAGIFGGDFFYSFWGNYERMSGIFHNLHLLTYFIILISVFKEKKDWYQFFAFTIFIAVIASVLALSQLWQIPQIMKSSGGNRLTGPVGNAAFFAGYLLLHSFLVLFFLIKKKLFPYKFFSYLIVGFNVFLVIVEIYKRVFTDNFGFIPVIFANWQLLAFLIIMDLFAIYCWFLGSAEMIKKISHRLVKYLLNYFPLLLILALFLFIIYQTETRGSILSSWISLAILLTCGFYLHKKEKAKTFLSLITFGLYQRQGQKIQILLAVLIVLVLFSQVFMYLSKDASFFPAEGTMPRIADMVPIIAFYLSIISILIIGLFFEKNKKYKIILAVFIISAVVFPAFLYLSRQASWVQGVPVLSRFANLATSKATSVESRMLTWKVSWQGMIDKPLLGWGPENFEIVFNKYFPPEIFKDQGSRVWFDRAHNIIFDVGVTAGFIGLISYLAIFIIAAYYLIKKFKQNKEFSTSLFFIVLLFAYLIQNIFVFDTVNTEIVIYLILAFITFLITDTGSRQTEAFEKINSKGINLFLIVLIFVPLLILIYGVNIKTLKANNLVYQSLRLNIDINSTENINKSINNFLTAIKLTPIGKSQVREQFSSYAQKIVKDKEIPRDAASKLADIAIVEIKQSIKERPNDIRQYLYLANLYNTAIEFNNNRSAKVIELLNEDVIALSPTRAAVYFEIGQAYLFQKDFDHAVEYFKKGVEISPWVLDSHFTLAQVYIIAGQIDKAIEEINYLNYQYFGVLGVLNVTISDVENKYYQLIEQFLNNKEYQPSINLMLELIKYYPNNASYHAKLAAIYADMGEKEKAILEAEKVIELDPTARDQSESFIDALNKEE